MAGMNTSGEKALLSVKELYAYLGIGQTKDSCTAYGNPWYRIYGGLCICGNGRASHHLALYFTGDSGICRLDSAIFCL